MTDFARFTGAVAACDHPAELWRLTVAHFSARGLPRVAYHQYGRRSETGLAAYGIEAQGLQATGFPEAEVAAYIAENLFEFDPLATLTVVAGHPVRWGDLVETYEMTEQEAEAIDRLRAIYAGQGASMAVHGPGLRHGYLALGEADDAPRRTNAELFELQCAGQVAHLRYCELVPPERDPTRELSPREREVLHWMARGKSNGVIAEILELSRHTVDTLVRRIFEKLGVADRTTAVVRGLGQGLVRPG